MLFKGSRPSRFPCEGRCMGKRTLFRPVGLAELELILACDARAFPPRLPEQPIFYPVLNREYAEQIARDWNTKDAQSGFPGFVTEFEVLPDYFGQFQPRVVGRAEHQEQWIPAEQLDEFNANLRSSIRVERRSTARTTRGRGRSR